MRIVVFAHSLLSDWNNGTAHFLRGVVSEFVARGHEVHCYEPRDAYAVERLLKNQGGGPIEAVQRLYPSLDVVRYNLDTIDLDVALNGAHLVIVSQWSSPELVQAVGQRRLSNPLLRLFFHDTNHRAISAPDEIAKFNLTNFDGVLAGGEVIRQEYLKRGWVQNAWTWHEAADLRMHRPIGAGTNTSAMLKRDLVWIGNWNSDETPPELKEFLLEPVLPIVARRRCLWAYSTTTRRYKKRSKTPASVIADGSQATKCPRPSRTSRRPSTCRAATTKPASLGCHQRAFSRRSPAAFR